MGICNGFQALIKLGLVPYGEIMRHHGGRIPTLTFNTIRRHQSMLVRTRVAIQQVPVAEPQRGRTMCIPIAISHGEGRFVRRRDAAGPDWSTNGQIATQYVDLDRHARRWICASIPTVLCWPLRASPAQTAVSLARWATASAAASSLYKNVTGDKYQPIFEGGVNYFKL